MPAVSIIVPHFNRSELIRETLASVEAQTMKDWEAILVDDGSTPVERAALDALSEGREQVRLLDRRDGEKGPSRCRNLGAQDAGGEFLLFLDSDDLLSPECLERRLDAASEEPENDLWVFPAANFSHRPGDQTTLWGTMRPGEDDAARFARGDAPWHTSSPLWRRESFLKLGGFNERILYGDDSELHQRAVLSGLRIRQYPESAPDAFVRRSEERRITNTLDTAMVRSRLIRLEEGCRTLKTVPGGGRLLPIWEGQHFVEAEFLLFKMATPCSAAPKIADVLALWEREFRPKFAKRLAARTYLRIALATRDQAYFVLRLARRLAKSVLPQEYFGEDCT